LVKVFGIRHHGPGSTLSLMKAFEAWEPDCVVVEAPADAQHAVEYIGHEGLLPPASILIYNPKNLAQASYLPFANFSPEWQVIKWANDRQVPVRLMDLPMGITFGESQKKQMTIEMGGVLNDEQQDMVRDPLGFLSHLAGYQDSERWWEVTFERSIGGEEVFPLVLELMAPMREETQAYLPQEEARREAFMRKTIREAVKEGHQKIAVVCGAWHAPILDNWMQYKPSVDAKILKGLKKVKTAATWIPWSYYRLAFQSGYGAGVISPAWYHMLFENRKDVVIKWMTKVAQLFRAEDLEASSAHAIEAVRLAGALAALRQMSIPGISEMKEAAVSIFCEGDETKMELIENQLIIGDVIGEVPDEIPVVPLQKDLEACIKSARLTKERNSLEEVEKKLDLRVASNLKASHLLHRLNILNIPWGTETEGLKYATGSFAEHWLLRWQPEFAIKIIEAGMWGNTVYSAAVALALHQAEDTNELPVITRLIELSLKANLADAIEALIEHFQQLSAMTKDVHLLMEALPPLVNAIRYGNTRQMEMEDLTQVVDQIIPRICIAMPGAFTQVKEGVALNLFKKLMACNHAINILDEPIHSNKWHEVLEQIVDLTKVNGLLTGGCTRLLFEKEIFDSATSAIKMSYALSGGNEPNYSANWIEGFLHGSGLLLIHNNNLWNILDEWINGLNMDSLQAILPLLRRTFSKFSGVERQKMLELAKLGQLEEVAVAPDVVGVDMARAKEVVPIVRVLLGL